jgi:tripartite-type tricarboxylate transporter receptor subunit TctC
MTHLNRGRRSALIIATAAALLGPVAHAQSPAWPQRPVRLVVPYGPGSSPDVMARILAERLAPRLGQPVVVENRAGAGGNVGTGAVARATPDGHTLVISTNGPLVNNTVLYGKLPYDPFRELAPVILAGGQANVCAVRADAGIGSMKELVAAMRARPGSFNFSSIGVGSLSHLGVELLKARTGSFAVHIPYPSSPAAITAVLQGDVQFSCVPAVAVMPQVRAGRLRALAVSTGTRSALMPEIPTLKEAGFPDVEAVAWMAVLAPAGTPADVIGRLNREMNAVLALPEVQERFTASGAAVVGGSVDEFRAFLHSEHEKFGRLLRKAGGFAQG